MTDFAVQRRTMVESQIRPADVTDLRIQEAMLEIAREDFVPAAARAGVYADRSIVLAPGRAMLDPRSFAKLVQAAAIESTERVLDIGCASGYSSAVIARIAVHVTALEENALLMRAARQLLRAAANVALAEGPLFAGWREGAPYDVIVMEGSVDFVPDSLFEQLGEGGRLAVVIRERAGGRAMVFTRNNGAIGERAVFDADVPPLPGFLKARGFTF